MSYTHSITSKGQITLPKEFRDKLGLDAIGQASIRLNQHNEIVISKPKTIEDIRAMLAVPAGAESMSEKEQLIVNHYKQKYDIR